MIRVLSALTVSVFLAGCISQPPAPAVDRTSAAQSKSSAAAQQAAPVVNPSGPGYYTVKRGDTLYRIALENGQDYKDLASWNGLANPSSIKEGQVLRVAPPGVVAESSGQVVAKPITNAPVVESRPLDSAPVSSAPAPASDKLKREPRVGKEPYSDEAYARLNRGEASPKVAVEAKPEPKVEQAQPAASPDDVVWAWPSSGKMQAGFNEATNKGLDFAGKAGDPVTAAADGKVVYAGSGLRGYGELVIVKHNATFLSAYAHNRKILVKEGQVVTRGQKIAEMGNTDSDAVKLHFEIRRQGKPIDPIPYLPKK